MPFLVTYTGKDVVELPGAGVFASGVAAFVTSELAEAARQSKDFSVVEASPSEPRVTTREEVDRAAQEAQGAAEPAEAAEAPKPKAKETAKAEEKKPEEKPAEV